MAKVERIDVEVGLQGKMIEFGPHLQPLQFDKAAQGGKEMRLSDICRADHNLLWWCRIGGELRGCEKIVCLVSLETA